MSYVVLARRFRPQTFADIIGQDHVSTILKNAIKEKRVAHAYLLSGPRGVGKTTAARIFAKALNCKNGPTPEPCGKCINCIEITSGSSVDVQEIDGASNRGIDEIRELRENVKFAPAASKYKIYIIDEAHQITDAAFNALLKTLEEPPEHVVFILATTEAQKIPITILSRCQKFRFRLISTKEIVANLEEILKKEKIIVAPEVLQTIASTTGGSMRDALSLLDQLISSGNKDIKESDASVVLGLLPDKLINEAAELCEQNDASAIMALVKEVNIQGYNLAQFASDLRSRFRKTLVYKINPSAVEITASEKQWLEKEKENFTQAWLVRSTALLSKAVDEMKRSEEPRIVLELCFARLCLPYIGADEILKRLEELEKNGGMQTQESTEKNNRSLNDVSASNKVSDNKTAYIITGSSENNVSDSYVSTDDSSGYLALWHQTIADFKKKHPAFGHMLKDSHFKALSPSGVLAIAVASRFEQETINSNKEIIEQIMGGKLGKSISMNIVVQESNSSFLPSEPQVVSTQEPIIPVKEIFSVLPESNTAPKIPSAVEKVRDLFKGTVKKN